MNEQNLNLAAFNTDRLLKTQAALNQDIMPQQHAFYQTNQPPTGFLERQTQKQRRSDTSLKLLHKSGRYDTKYLQMEDQLKKLSLLKSHDRQNLIQSARNQRLESNQEGRDTGDKQQQDDHSRKHEDDADIDVKGQALQKRVNHKYLTFSGQNFATFQDRMPSPIQKVRDIPYKAQPVMLTERFSKSKYSQPIYIIKTSPDSKKNQIFYENKNLFFSHLRPKSKSNSRNGSPLKRIVVNPNNVPIQQPTMLELSKEKLNARIHTQIMRSLLRQQLMMSDYLKKTNLQQKREEMGRLTEALNIKKYSFNEFRVIQNNINQQQ
ncbi:UNKNOWN [Stylonychia lemnae]|uniref:Uncharacterized protein n=1 Tax=Stylonychia lemnae TaxID=5949 RepID=A0A078A7J8_STYLE|nr:UNKNOWN [Stylonychia lemnae]|eukprot:CDW77841.1 UNKNOWN [Stylonychia lemnae]